MQLDILDWSDLIDLVRLIQSGLQKISTKLKERACLLKREMTFCCYLITALVARLNYTENKRE